MKHLTQLCCVVLAALTFSSFASQPTTSLSKDVSEAAQVLIKKSEFQEGVHYHRIQPTGVQPPVTPNVIEFFWYGCPSCYQLEQSIQTWLKTKPSTIDFKKVPSTLGREIGIKHAKLFYIAEALHEAGYLNQFDSSFHLDVFNLVHQAGKQLIDKSAQAEFFKSKGVSEEIFNEMYDSFGVEANFKKGLAQAKKYHVAAVPVMIVNHQFMTSPSLVGSFEELIDVVNYLTQQGLAQPAG